MATLVARDDELADALRAIRSGRGVIIVGEAGVGKSSLATAVAESATAAAWVVATSAGRAVPFGALGTLLPADLATVHPAVVPGLLSRRLRELAGGRPALLVIDDIQHLDDHSAAAVLALVGANATRLLATLRTGLPTSDAVTMLWKDGLVERLDLRPLNRDASRVLLADRLGGDLASGTAELLWLRSRGNPLYLSELVRFGTTTGRLRLRSGMWWWHGETGLPPRLGELLQRRIDSLSDAGRDTLDVLAMGDGLPYETLAAVSSIDGVMDVDERGVVVSDERDGVLRLRFAHPLLHAVAERRLTPARRRVLSQRLRAVPAAQLQHVGVLERAAWEEAAGDRPDVEVLLGAADATMLSDPAGAVRLARRAVQFDGGVRAALALSAAHSEAGDPVSARSAWQRAAHVAETDDELLAVGLEDLSLSMWGEREPHRAAERLARLADRLPATFADELDSAAALLTVFMTRPSGAGRLAQAVLGRNPAFSPQLRALTTYLAAVVLSDDSATVLSVVDRLTATLAGGPPVAATRSGLAHAFIAQAQLIHTRGEALPAMAGSSGRWPVGPSGPVPAPNDNGNDGEVGGDAGFDSDAGTAPRWPLLVGVRHHLVGDWTAALAALREAYVQQHTGEGLFRSEATAELVVVLAGSGHGQEAGEVLDRAPPDAVAYLPGLLPWAQAAVQAADGHGAQASSLAFAAAGQASAEGLVTLTLRYLADAARFGGRAGARAALDAIPAQLTGRQSLARAAGIRARASGREADLVDASQQHLALGLLGQAVELATLADGHPAAGRLRREAAARLGARDGTAPPLTPRELQIARLAARGMPDKDIAEVLVVSVRTVESHLRAVYRKLDIGSRRELSGALGSRASEVVPRITH